MSHTSNDWFYEMQQECLETKLLLGEITQTQYEQACKRVTEHLEDYETALANVISNFGKTN